MQFNANFDVIDKLAGAVAGIESAFDDPAYIDNLVDAAHNDASMDFDMAAASAASAGFINHVYEFGVSGITRGPVRVADPTSEAARLWVHQVSGTQGAYNIQYAFRPAIIPNPRPTTAYTGVPSKVLRRLSKRKYVFYRKAFVMESGQSVEIHAKSNDWLFVPFGAGNARGNKTYMMWHYPTRGPLTVTPGRNTKGTFTAFWESWWLTTGEKIMMDKVTHAVTMDVNAALDAAAAAAAKETVVPVGSTGDAEIAAQRTRTHSVMVKKSKARRGGRKRR